MKTQKDNTLRGHSRPIKFSKKIINAGSLIDFKDSMFPITQKDKDLKVLSVKDYDIVWIAFYIGFLFGTLFTLIIISL